MPELTQEKPACFSGWVATGLAGPNHLTPRRRFRLALAPLTHLSGASVGAPMGRSAQVWGPQFSVHDGLWWRCEKTIGGHGT